ncbi:MAG: NAD(+)/NADH kinase [Bacteroidaceae bacterium]|nr:NAD(+)/NADH kinase [Bacteroidaceae bacterium]
MSKGKIKFALFGNECQEHRLSCVREIFSFLAERHLDFLIEKDFFDSLTDELRKQIPAEALITDKMFDADYVISIGGDGTFLKAAAYVGEKDIPIVGINIGHLGFLTDADADEVKEELQMILNGDYDIDNRTVIEANSQPTPNREQSSKLELPRCEGGRPKGQRSTVNCQQPILTANTALNDIAILKTDNASMISIRICINDEYLATYEADGLIISTPTGSTAYSLSAGGPVVVPKSKSLILTAVAPHSLNVRPIVITDDSTIKLSVKSRTGNFLLAIDGRSEVCGEHTDITIKKASYHVSVIRRRNRGFFSTMRNKLFLGARVNED